MLTEERKGEIALMILKMRLRMDGIRLGRNTRREIGNTAKELGVPFEEALQLMEELTKELMVETFVSTRNDTGVNVS
jgi:hypothetical protein